MTISVSLHRAARSHLSRYTSDEGYVALTIYAEEFQGSEDSVDVWFPAALAEEIHGLIERHRKAAEPEAAL